jgi:hypothetical protein
MKIEGGWEIELKSFADGEQEKIAIIPITNLRWRAILLRNSSRQIEEKLRYYSDCWKCDLV